MGDQAICTCPNEDPPSLFPEDFSVTMTKTSLINQWRDLQARIDQLPEAVPEYWLIKGMEFELLAMWCSLRYCICRFDYPSLPFKLAFDDHIAVMELYSKHVGRCCLRYRKLMMARDREYLEMREEIGEKNDEGVWRDLEGKQYEKELHRCLEQVFDEDLIREIVVKVVGEEMAAEAASKNGDEPVDNGGRRMITETPMNLLGKQRPRGKRKGFRRWVLSVLRRLKINKV